MSQDKTPKTRRRFLADLLFLGSGLTAAALLARTVSEPGSPVTAPPSPAVTSEPPPSSNPAVQPTPEPMVEGEMVLPDGDYELPECESPLPEGASVAVPASPDATSPHIRGRMKMPEAEPTPHTAE